MQPKRRKGKTIPSRPSESKKNLSKALVSRYNDRLTKAGRVPDKPIGIRPAGQSDNDIPIYRFEVMKKTLLSLTLAALTAGNAAAAPQQAAPAKNQAASAPAAAKEAKPADLPPPLLPKQLRNRQTKPLPQPERKPGLPEHSAPPPCRKLPQPPLSSKTCKAIRYWPPTIPIT